MDHEDAFTALPWLVNGTLSPAERAALEIHLAGCERCARELRLLRDMDEAVRAAPLLEDAMERGLASLRPRLAGEPGRRTPLTSQRPPTRRRPQPSLTRAPLRAGLLGLAMVATVALAVWAGRAPETRDDPTLFRTLTAQPDVIGAARLTVEFAPGATEAAVRALLLGQHLEIVRGPTAGGLYTLAAGGGDARPAEAIAQALQDDPAIRRALVAPGP